mgnify:CR=1 FL=1
MDIIILSGPAQGRRITIQETDVLIGRRANCNVCLQDDRLSGEHAQLHYENGHWFVYDLSSSNGTWVNRQRLSQGYMLRPGDELGVGKTVMRFENLNVVGAAAAPYPMYDSGALYSEPQPIMGRGAMAGVMATIDSLAAALDGSIMPVSYTHLTLPTKRIV